MNILEGDDNKFLTYNTEIYTFMRLKRLPL